MTAPTASPSPSPPPSLAPAPSPSPSPRAPRRPFAWRRLLRGVHRDIGYLAVGLTLVYAVSGIAVNHIATWDPSFEQFTRTITVPPAALAGPDDATIAAAALAELAVDETPSDVYRASDTRLDITLAHSTVHVNPTTGVIAEEGQRARPVLRAINWLHLNRGKQAWTLFADLFAGALVFLALSGLFMLRGRQGVLGWRGLYVVAGAAIPIIYLVWSGGP